MEDAFGRERVREKVRRLLETDFREGALGEEAAYKNLFPGWWDLVSEEYAAVGGGPGPPAPGGSAVPERPGGEAGPGDPGAVHRLGPYSVLREIGRGGMGVVYEAQDTRLPRHVALKVLSPQFASSPQLRLRFEREASIAARLDHPNICTVYETGVDGETPWIAMRRVEGRTLAALLAEARGKGRRSCVVHLSAPAEEPGGAEGAVPPHLTATGAARLELDRVLALFEKVARALHDAHEKGLVHRDVKPENIMVTPAGEPVILDFGLARDESAAGAGLTMTGALMGTPAYMSPEQLLPQRIRPDRRTDVYSLGASLYECLTLKLPFTGATREALFRQILTTEPEDPRRANPRISRDLGVVVSTAMEKDRDRRYHTALEFAEDLERLRRGEPIRARPVGPLGRAVRWSKRKPALAASTAGIFLALSGGLAASLHYLGVAREETRARAAERDAKEVSLRRARLLGLVSASTVALTRDPTSSLLLAREAVRIEPCLESLSALHAALAGSLERVRFTGHGGPVHRAVFSPSEDRILTVSEDGTARIWDPDGRERHVLRGHEAGVTGGAFSPDGRTVLTASRDGTARLWGAEGRPLAVFRGHGGPVVTAVFSASGDRILTASRDATARLWDLEGNEQAVFRGHGGPLIAACFHPTRPRVFTASEDGTWRFWETTGQETGLSGGHRGPLLAAALSADGKRLLTTGQDGRILLWDHGEKSVTALHECTATPGAASFATATGNCMAVCGATVHVFDGQKRELTRLSWHKDVMNGVAWSPAGDRILLWANDGFASIWDLHGDQREVLRGHGGPVESAAFSSGGDRVLTASTDGTARLWAADGSEVAVIPRKPGYFTGARVSRSGDRILVTLEDSTARLHGLDGRELAVYRGHEKGVLFADFTPDGTRVLTSGGDLTARMWDLEGRELLVLRGHEGAIRTVMPLPGGRGLVTCSDDRTVRFWDMKGECLAVGRGHGDAPMRLAANPRGDRVASSSVDGTVRIWDLEGREIAVCRGHEGVVRPVEFAPSGDRILSAAADGTVRAWDLEGRQLAVFRGHENWIWDGRLSPAGDRYATASRDRTARIWDLSGKELAVLRGSEDWLMTLAFSPSGDSVITASHDGAARIYDLSGRLRVVLRGPARPLVGVAFAGGGEMAVTSGFDGTAKVWTLRTDELLRVAERRILRDFTPDERVQYADLLAR